MTAERSHSAGPPAFLPDFVIAASITIALTSYFGYLVRSGYLADGAFYHWWRDCFFSWQIPAFYCASGYYYQRGAPVNSLGAWGRSVRYRLIVNGAPFLAFTVLMLLANALVGASPAFGIPELADALFVAPLEPYGYFYCLFILFVLVPTVKSGRGLAALGVIALAAKAFALCAGEMGWALPYGVTGVPAQMIWFVAGMAIALLDGGRLLRRPAFGVGCVLVFVGLSIVFMAFGARGALVTFWCALSGGGAVIGLLAWAFPRARNPRPLGFLANYTMAIYLFHPILLKLLWWAFGTLGVVAPVAYYLCGALVALVIPVLLMIAMNHVWKLGFIVYPARYLTLKP